MDGMALIRAQRGLLTKLTKGLGFASRSAISQWDRVPAERIVEIERITGIPRHQLRPDLWLPPSDQASS